MQDKKVSVVLIVKNERSIEQTLLLLQPQIEELQAECVVVDSSTQSLIDIAEQFPWVNWIAYEHDPKIKKATIAEQRNVGVNNSHGEVIAFCDAGGTPQAGWLKAITSPILLHRATLTGGPIFASNPESLNPWINQQMSGEIIEYPTTANLAVSRSAFDLVGGFNEELSYGSDADFVWRLARQGVDQVAVADAVMGLDGGDRTRERKRTWKYGRAIVDLLNNFPEKRKTKFLSNPEIWLYPILEIAAFGSLITMWLSRIIALMGAVAFLLINAALMLRNRKLSRPWELMIRCYIYGTAILIQIFTLFTRAHRLSSTLLYPPDNARYLIELRRALTNQKISCQDFPTLTRFNSLNILALPFQSIALRLRGVRIVHIHWLYRFNVSWAQSALGRRVLQWWFYIWLLSLRAVGIQIIWTVHNLLPHDQIFRDDRVARKYLISKSAAVISLSNNSRQELISNFGAKKVLVIPEGPLYHSTPIDRQEMRERLGVGDNQTLIIAVGKINRYKGLSDLLRAAKNLDHSIAIRIAGEAPQNYQSELVNLLNEARSTDADIQMQFGELTDEEFGGYLKAADFFAAPFREITNSGSINAALAAQIPVIIPNMDSLEWVPLRASIRFPNGENRIDSISKALKDLLELSDSDRGEMREAAKLFTDLRSWVVVAKRHRDLYLSLLGGDNA